MSASEEPSVTAQLKVVEELIALLEQFRATVGRARKLKVDLGSVGELGERLTNRLHYLRTLESKLGVEARQEDKQQVLFAVAEAS